MKSLPFAVSFRLLLLCSIALQAQNVGSQQRPLLENPKLLQRPSTAAATDRPIETLASPQQIELKVPAGTPIRIAITKRVRIARAGTAVSGKVTDTVYAFDQPVIRRAARCAGTWPG